MAKRTASKQPAQIRKDWCRDCQHNQGEDEQFHYMWHCSFLSVCCAFGLTYCKAEKLGKGKFKPK